MAHSVRVGVVGTGVMGAQHAGLLAHEVPGAVLAGVFDADASRASALAQPLDVRVARDVDELLAAVDGVVIATADATHEAIVMRCLEAGVAVLCEKPLSPDLAGARRIVAAESATGRRSITVGFMRRFDTGYAALRSAVRDGSLGSPLLIHCTHRNRVAVGDGSARSLIAGSAEHEFDILRWLTGTEIVQAQVHAGRTAPGPGAARDPVLLVLRTSDDVVVTVEVFVNASYGYEVRCEVVGSAGTATLDDVTPVVLRRSGVAGRALPANWTPRFADAYRRELVAWVRAAAAGTLPAEAASAWDGLVAGRVAEAALEAFTSGVAVSIEPDPVPAFYHAPAGSSW